MTEGLSFSRLKAMAYDEVRDHAKHSLALIGKGTARHVYRLSSRFVLKLAVESPMESTEPAPKGIAQNQHEFENQGHLLLPRVHEHADDFSWIVSDLVRPLRDEEEFCEIVGIRNMGQDPGSFRYAIDAMSAFLGIGKDRKNVDVKSHGIEIRHSINELITSLEIDRFELDDITQWGKNTDGKLVLLDNGANRHIFDKYYG